MWPWMYAVGPIILNKIKELLDEDFVVVDNSNVTKTEFNNCFIIHCKVQTKFIRLALKLHVASKYTIPTQNTHLFHFIILSDFLLSSCF